MTKLTVEQLLYLLYARAYLESGTVTKSIVKSCLTKAWKEKTEEIYQFLLQQHLIEIVGRGRFKVTDLGKKVLVSNLRDTDYRFDSVKGAKVLNTLLICVKESTKALLSDSKMTFDEFQGKFKALFFEERSRQELQGVVAIHSVEICKKFDEQNIISQDELGQYFELLKSTGKIFSVMEKGKELIQWAE